MRSAGIDARSGALGKRFDAYPWRHPVTESSYINRLANRLYRSTVKTLPATGPSNPGSESIDRTTRDFNLDTLSLDYHRIKCCKTL
jgi:hypothetical protein